jgi:hypothetical protein
VVLWQQPLHSSILWIIFITSAYFFYGWFFLWFGFFVVLQETYAIEDCWYYSTTEYTGTSVSTLDISLPSTFSVDFDIKPTSRSSASSYVEIGASTTNCLVVGQITSGGVNGI